MHLANRRWRVIGIARDIPSDVSEMIVGEAAEIDQALLGVSVAFDLGCDVMSGGGGGDDVSAADDVRLVIELKGAH